MVETDRENAERIRARAKHLVYERLALASAVIWSLGALILMATIVPYIAHPQKYIMIASVVPLFPAALPWLFWRPLTDALIRRWSARSKV
jgi:hypothetical protein